MERYDKEMEATASYVVRSDTKHFFSVRDNRNQSVNFTHLNALEATTFKGVDLISYLAVRKQISPDNH
jgi:chemotaxis methyl-accepting protein methylase